MDITWWFGQSAFAAVLCIFGVAVWKIILWAKVAIAEPVAVSHLKLITTLNEHLPRQTYAIDMQTAMLEQMKETVEKTFNRQIELYDKVIASQTEIIKAISTREAQ